MDSQGFLLPHDNFLGACETAEAADAALERLREEDLLVIHLFSALEGNHVDHVGYGIGIYHGIYWDVSWHMLGYGT